MDHGRAETCRAVIEGCSFALRDIVDRLAGLGLRVDGLRVTGGGARSNLWLQIKADVTGVPVRAVAGEGAAMGAVCLASVAAGWFDNIEAAAQSLVEVGPEIFEPETGLSGVYEDGYQRYRQVFDALEPVYQP
jgi:xylulokinase